ncbi:MAG: amino acid transporter, family [Clostridia bacterium]|nr:gamma-aminobutyrate permease-like transporter [Clostridiales bacterium]MDK2985115.1 amino acid transporter, family [Clostridia bacterium]
MGRMVRSLASAGHAPLLLIDKGDVPLKGILFSGAAMLAAVALGYILPSRIYIFLVSSGGFSLLFAYVVIMFTHYRFRKMNGCPPHGHCQLAGFPYTSWLAIVSLLIIVATMPLIPGQGSGLFAGLILVAFYSLTYLLFKILPQKLNPQNLAPTKPLFLENKSIKREDFRKTKMEFAEENSQEED